MGISAPTPITRDHDLTLFDCGYDSLNLWLKKKALKNEASGASRSFVVCQGNTVIGYYALASGAVAHTEAPGNIRRNMPEPIPVMVLGRLAVCNQWKGHRIGSGMLKDAVQRTLAVAQHIGVRALLVHALSEDAKQFYMRLGFHPSPANDMTLMVTLHEAKKALQA